MELKPISQESIPRALELAERYRLLDEPEQAASICSDVLAAQPGNTQALLTLFLATTEQFGHAHGTKLEDADKIVAQMSTDYERAYYGALARERWARSRLQLGSHASLVGDWIRRAMDGYAEAERLRPLGNDDPILRWNACVRLVQRFPGLAQTRDNEHEHWD
jgi:hypothetical protein